MNWIKYLLLLLMSQGITYNIPDFVLKTLLVCLKNLDWLDYISRSKSIGVSVSKRFTQVISNN